MKQPYKTNIWWVAGLSLGLLGVTAVCVYITTETLPTVWILVPVGGWALLIVAYYLSARVRYVWDEGFIGGAFVSYERNPCTYNLPVGTPLTLHDLSTLALPCEACNLPLVFPTKTQAVYLGHVSLETLVVDALRLQTPLQCKNCGETLHTLALPCSAPGYSYQAPPDKAHQ